MKDQTATPDPLGPERLTFNPTTRKTKVWTRRTDDPAWNAKIDEPVAVYTPTNIRREVFDLLPPGPQVIIVTERQKAGVGWRQVDRRWESYSLDHRRVRRVAILPVRRTPRRRGAGRPASSRRSSARSGDSGDDGESSEPPKRRRLCSFCGRDIPADRAAQAKFCSDKHAGADRQRRKRERDRARDDPATDGPTKPGTYTVYSTAEYEALRKRIIEDGCRCNGHHIAAGRDDEPSPRCVKCGHRLGRLNDAGASAGGLRSRQLVVRGTKRQALRYGDGKRHQVKHRKVKPRQGVAA